MLNFTNNQEIKTGMRYHFKYSQLAKIKSNTF